MSIEARVAELNRRLLADLGDQEPFQWKKAEDLQILTSANNILGKTAYRPEWRPLLDPSYFGRYILARKEPGTLVKDDWVPWIVSDESNPSAQHFTSELNEAPTPEKTSWAISIIRAERAKYQGKSLDDINKQVAKEFDDRRAKAGRAAADRVVEEFEEQHKVFGGWRMPGAKTWISAPTPGAPNTLVDKEDNGNQ